MANRFDVVSVGIDDESGVLVGVIARAKPGGAVVFAAGFQRRAMEGGDLRAVLRHWYKQRQLEFASGAKSSRRPEICSRWFSRRRTISRAPGLIFFAQLLCTRLRHRQLP